MGRKLLGAGCWMLVAGCWLLGAGCWLLVACCWLLVTGKPSEEYSSVTPSPRHSVTPSLLPIAA